MSFDKLFDGSDAHLLPSNPAECADILRRHNEWRRWDGDIGEQSPEMLPPVEIGFAIDMAIELIEQRDTLLAACEKTLVENGHLADGDSCTLIDIKRAVEKVKGGAA